LWCRWIFAAVQRPCTSHKSQVRIRQSSPVSGLSRTKIILLVLEVAIEKVGEYRVTHSRKCRTGLWEFLLVHGTELVRPEAASSFDFTLNQKILCCFPESMTELQCTPDWLDRTVRGSRRVYHLPSNGHTLNSSNWSVVFSLSLLMQGDTLVIPAVSCTHVVETKTESN
jgi:hypothetical protein